MTVRRVQVHRHCTEVGLTEEEREVRRQALYIIENLNLVNLAMRLCDFKDIHMAVEAKQVSLIDSSAECPLSTSKRRSVCLKLLGTDSLGMHK